MYKEKQVSFPIDMGKSKQMKDCNDRTPKESSIIWKRLFEKWQN